MTNSEIVKMGYAIQNYLNEMNLLDAKPKDLMPLLIEKGFFSEDRRNGLPLRNILRQLDDENLLYLLPQVRVERKDKNRLWSSNPVKI
ncbi:hypothetical protein [uncultured Psychroserpens sp.]|uniref:hypothetical protein n=1 Tax=uncultured Psychroserpens sp. TaxID=255436 RepID=UPI0026079229|nr:hypothetical protein [uncultured Psychroserpens sp.]